MNLFLPLARGIFSFIGLMMLINTVYDYIAQSMNWEAKQWLLLFSMFRNLEHIFNFEQKTDVKEISCIYGLKAISMMWIIFGHTYMWNVLAPLNNGNILEDVSYCGFLIGLLIGFSYLVWRYIDWIGLLYNDVSFQFIGLNSLKNK